MTIKCRMTAFTVATCVLALTSAFAGEMATSSGPIVPGEWNSHFYAGKEYAEANNVPMLLFWANPGCGNCANMISAVSTPGFQSWMATSGLVFVFVQGTSTAEKSDAKAFAKNSSLMFPYMSVYYPTASGWKKNNFTGMSGYMPSRAGRTLGDQLISSVESIVGSVGGSGGGSSGGSGGGSSGGTSGIPDDWRRARSVKLSIDDASGWCQGRIEVSFGRANTRTGKADVKATVELFSGKKVRFSGKVKASANPFSLKKTGYTLTLSSSAAGVSGSLSGPAGNFSLNAAVFGGAVAVNTFSILDPPTMQGSNPVLTQFLGDVSIHSNGVKWNLPAGGTVKWNRVSGAFESTSADNPSALKLSYKSKTGVFTGSMSVYVQTGPQKAKKLKAKITGCVVNGLGYGEMTCSGISSIKVVVIAK